MEPGRALDALIAEHIFGCEVHRNPKGGWSIGEPDWYDDAGAMYLGNPLPCYSTDIAAAWALVEQVRGEWDLKSRASGWRACLAVPVGPSANKYVEADGETAPHAICLAAMGAMDEDGGPT